MSTRVSYKQTYMLRNFFYLIIVVGLSTSLTLVKLIEEQIVLYRRYLDRLV